MSDEITNMEDFRQWVRVELAIRHQSQRALAKKMDVQYPRISEAMNGKPSGRKYVIPLIEALGGDPKRFKL